MYTHLINRLLKSDEPSIAFLTRTLVLRENPTTSVNVALQQKIRTSDRAQKLLTPKAENGRLLPLDNPYSKWDGAHWTLASLADIGYPEGDESLFPIRDQVYEEWLAPFYLNTIPCKSKKDVYQAKGVPVLEGRVRRCASQQGNALYSTVKLGIADERAETLAKLLLKWQWPDGGWNCDKKPEAQMSSFTETHIALRALILYAKVTRKIEYRKAASRAAEFLMHRYLFLQKSNGQPMQAEFVKLHYPCYWHYDILFGLRIMAEGGWIRDERCSKALDLLVSKQLPEGGWTANSKYFKLPQEEENMTLGCDKVDWSAPGRNRINEWITVGALYVLSEAGRL